MIGIYERLLREHEVLRLHDHMDTIISGETIIDLKCDAGLMAVWIQLWEVQREKKLFGIIVITTSDTIECILLHEVIIGVEIYIMMDCGDDPEIEMVIIGDQHQAIQ